MNKLLLCIVGAFILSQSVLQAKTAGLKEIIGGNFKAEKMETITSMNDGEYFTKKSNNGKMILKYSYRSGKVTDTLFNVATAKECPFKTFDGYTLSEDEKIIMLYSDREPVYRRSFKANYYTFEIKRNLIKPLSENGKQQAAIFSPNSRYVAFVRDNNIFIKDLVYSTETAATKDGEKNKIINGIPDWVYEEEFALTNSMAWAPDNSSLAFIKYDETDVPEYSIQMFEGYCPSLTEYELYPGEFQYKYPVAGKKNATVAVYSYSIEYRVVKKLDVPLDADGYIPRIRFTSNPEQLAVMTLNRHQNQFKMFATNPRSGVSKLLIQEQSKYWIDTETFDMITFYPDFFIFPSEKSGYRQLYQYSPTGTLIKQITRGNWDVTEYLGYNPQNKNFYYQSATEGPLYRAIYKTDAKDKTVNLSEKKGTNRAQFSKTCSYFINEYSSINTPDVVTVQSEDGKTLRTVENNKSLQQTLSKIETVTKEFFTFKNSAGDELNGWMMKPLNFNPGQKYPVVMIQYSGPGSQLVTDSWSFGWEQYLAANGYVVACVDGRGTGCRDVQFEKCIYQKMGVFEAQDQIETARYLGALDFVDKQNIAIWGWSFGGYNTLMSMTLGNGIFKAGIAIAPVTDWKYYDSIYTERYMRTPKENFEGYEQTSPLRMANKLSGRLLIISGTADDNVHFLNTVQYCSALIQANKQYDMRIYPNCDHSITGCNTRLHLYTGLVDFLQQNLKNQQ